MPAMETSAGREHAVNTLLLDLTRNVPGLVFQLQLLVDGSFRFLFASPGMEAMYEVPVGQAMEDACLIFQRLHPDDLQRVMQSLLDSAANLSPWECEHRVTLPRQGERWRAAAADPQRQADGSTVWHGYISDVTAHKQSENTQSTFNQDFGSFLEQTTDFVYFKNREGRMRFCSQSLADVYGYAHWHDLVGKLDRDLFPEEAMKEFASEGGNS